MSKRILTKLFSSQNVLFPTFCCQLDKYPLSSKLMKKCGLYFDIHSKIESPSLEILGNDLEVLFQVRQCVRRLLLFLSEINSPNVWPAKGGRKTCVTYCVRRTGNNWTKSRKTVLACDFVTLFRSFFLFLFASIFFNRWHVLLCVCIKYVSMFFVIFLFP